MSFERFCQPVCFFAARFTLRQPKTTNLFWRLSICISRDSLSCDTRSLNLCILFKFLFSYLWYIPPHSCAFDTFYFTPIFSYVYYLAKYFSYPWWRCCSEFLLLGIFLLFLISAVKGLIWDLSNVLSNVYSFHTMEFSMKHKYKLAHIYQQSFKPCCYCSE